MRLRWPPWKRRKKDDVRQEESPVSRADINRRAQFAEGAQRRASWDLRVTRQRGEEVARLAGYFEGRIDRNHWAEMMEQSFQRNQDG